MFILLAISSAIYFFVGIYREGIIMVIAIILISGISFYQEYRSRNAIRALQRISTPKCKVIRNNSFHNIVPEELVVNDIILIEEGEIIPADGNIISANDFMVNEAVLTGETFAIAKTIDNKNVYKGTLVIGGSAVIQLTAVGNSTQFGKIHKSLVQIDIEKTPLQIQIRSFVKNMSFFGATAFIIVVGYHLFQSGNFIQSLLQGLTLAMSVIPEEIPVAFATFQALGAFRLLKNNIIVKHPQYVEALGSATVICVDKTGTITKNEMVIKSVYSAIDQSETDTENLSPASVELIEYAMWSCEVTPFDPMEIAIHDLYTKITTKNLRQEFKQIHEYPLAGHPPIMTHIFQNNTGEIIIAAKGAPESIIKQSKLSISEKNLFNEQAKNFAAKGYRVIGVGKATWKNTTWPGSQEDFLFNFLGFIIFDDPPKEGITQTISTFLKAGIKVKMITGDYAETASAIGRKAGIEGSETVITGDKVLTASDKELDELINSTNIFARMFPDAKLKLVKAMKANGEVVAMTGDGVNDAPALKAAHIGIAMGTRGSEVAKNAAMLIISDDNLYHMAEAIEMGRKTFDNLKKAIRYIISIHIPIILIVIIPLLFQWQFTDIFSPAHVILLELLMAPTCSIVYENEPVEIGTMQRPPRKLQDTFLNLKQLGISIIQGVFITSGCLILGYTYMHNNYNEYFVRTIIFTTLLFSNALLILVNRSFIFSVRQTILYKNKSIIIILAFILFFILISLNIRYIQSIFRLTYLDWHSVTISAVTAIICTCWIELWKYFNRKKLIKANGQLAHGLIVE